MGLVFDSKKNKNSLGIEYKAQFRLCSSVG